MWRPSSKKGWDANKDEKRQYLKQRVGETKLKQKFTD